MKKTFSGGISIRTAREQDAEAILGIYSYYVEHTAITFEYEVPTGKEFAGRIRETLLRFPYLVMERKEKIIGYAYAGYLKKRAAYDWACEMTIYMDHELTHGGLGKILYTQLEEELQKMGILNFYACIGYPEAEDEYLTKNSQQFHEHMGYRQIGLFTNCGYKFGRWYHMIWMEKIVGNVAAPAPVIPYPQVSDRI